MSYFPSKNLISSSNSTTSLLTSGSTFTGTWEDVTNYNSVIVAVKTDVDGTFTVQFSPDGTNVDSTLTRYYRTSQIEAPHRFTITRKYCRVTFTNTSASDQTYIRLQTMYGDKENLNAPLDSKLAQDFDALPTRPTDWHSEVALGRRQNAITWNKFGYNNDIDTGASEVVASFGGTYSPLLAASTLDITSTDSNDTDGGTGANSLIIWGINADYEPITEVISLAGVSTVTTSNSYLGVNRASIYLAGTSLGNVGTITLAATSDASIQGQMPAGEGTTQQCIFHVGANRQALASWLYINTLRQSTQNPKVTVKGWVYSDVANAKFEVFRQGIDTAVENTVPVNPPEPFIIGEKSTFWIEASTDKDNTQVNVRFSLIEVTDVDA